jgi:hypothetical protein
MFQVFRGFGIQQYWHQQMIALFVEGNYYYSLSNLMLFMRSGNNYRDCSGTCFGRKVTDSAGQCCHRYDDASSIVHKILTVPF